MGLSERSSFVSVISVRFRNLIAGEGRLSLFDVSVTVREIERITFSIAIDQMVNKVPGLVTNT